MQVLYAPTVRTGASTAPDTADAAWRLDVQAFHNEFDELFAQLAGPLGTRPLLERAAELWDSEQPEVRNYVSRVPTDLPEEWEAEFHERHLAQWYRILMAPHIEPCEVIAAPDTVRDGLPRLGWSSADARRAAAGRELCTLAGFYGSPACGEAMSLVLAPGSRGWLSGEDVDELLGRLRCTDRIAFRGNQDLVAVCEELWRVLRTYADGSDRPVLMHHP